MDTTTGTGAPTGQRRPFADLSVNVKILTAIGLAALVALTVGVLGLQALSGASAAAQQIYTSNVASIKAVGQIQTGGGVVAGEAAEAWFLEPAGREGPAWRPSSGSQLDVGADRIPGRWEASEDHGSTWRKHCDLMFERTA